MVDVRRVMVRLESLGGALALAALLALLCAGGARAAAPFEPNDSRESAYGPLAGDVYHSAAIETVNDVDWYYFYVKSYNQFDFAATMLKEGTCSADFYLRDKNGDRLPSSYFEAGYFNHLSHFNITLEPGLYYLEVDSCTGDPYKFKISPAAGLTTSRECGEAIVSKGEIAPLLSELGEDLAENGELLARKRAAVRKAKRVARRLAKRRGVSRWTKRSAQRRVRAAKRARARVLQARRDLQALNAQRRRSLSDAESQIATYC